MNDAANKENIEAIYPLSPMQEGMLFHTLANPESGAYFEQYSCTYKGEFNNETYKRAWQGVVDKNPVLRTLVVWDRKDRPLQVVRHQVTLEWHDEDLSGHTESEREAVIEAFLERDLRRGFDLKRAPLMRMALFRLAEDEVYFVWSFHHLILDGWSTPRLFNDLFELYAAYANGKAVELTPAIPYRNYIAWLQKQDREQARAYWSQVLAGFSSPTSIDIDTAGDRDTTQGDYHKGSLNLSRDATSTLQVLARQHHVTLNTIVQGAWAILLSKYCREDDVLFGSTVSGRPADMPGIESMVGLFINTLPVRVKMDYEAALFDWFGKIQEQQISSREYEWSPLVDVQKCSDVPAGTALFDSIVVFENYPTVDHGVADTGFVAENETTREVTNYPLTIGVEVYERMLLNCTYDVSRFDASAIDNLLAQYKNILENIARHPEQKLGSVSLLDSDQLETIVQDWNRTRVDHGQAQCIHELVDEIARRNPGFLAIQDPARGFDYGEMNARANALASALQARGAGRDSCVGVLLQRSANLPVVLLAVLKAGAAYLPIDPGYPKDRIEYMLSDSAAPIIVSESILAEKIPAGVADSLLIDDFWTRLDESASFATGDVTPDSLAYVIYTSGSTGLPKGVRITHRSLYNLVRWHQRAYEITADDRASVLAGLAFDAAVWEIWPYLTAGASLHMPDEEVRLSPPATLDWLSHRRISVCFLPTPLAEAILLEEIPGDIGLKFLLTGGDKLHSPPCKEIPFKLVNHYGPTENTVVSTATEIDISAPGKGEPSIGRPIDNTKAYVLDGNRVPVPAGVPGELYVSGVGLAAGYVNQEDLTASVFVANPFSGERNSRMYRTGDLVRYLPDGNLAFLGRVDAQVKIHGYRIELGEIESVLNALGNITASAVVVWEGTSGEKQLVAYLVAENGTPPETAEIRARLKEKLPAYMVPAFYVALDEMPLTSNGKVDRKALPEPDVSAMRTGKQFEAATTVIEQHLVDIWKAVLSLERVGIHDNFFELGGDSILSIQIISRARQQNIHLAPGQLFQHPTIAELASVADSEAQPGSDQGAVTGSVELMPIQKWFFEQDLLAAHHWNQAYLLALPPDVNQSILARSLALLMQHHDALRLAYTRENGAWRQSIKATAETAFQVIDLSGVEPGQRANVIDARAGELQAGLDLETGKLVETALFDLGDSEKKRLLIVIHHLAVDGVSWRILLEDLESAYRQFEARGEAELPGKTMSIKDWADKASTYARSDTLQREFEYWNELQIASAIPVDYPGETDNTSGSVETCLVALSRDETRSLLQDVPAAYNTQINDVLLTALALAYLEWTGNPTMTLNLEGHGREALGGESLDVSRTVGWFTSLYPVALQLETAWTPGQCLMSVKEQLRRIPNRGIGFGLLRYLGQEKQRVSLADKPEPQLLFNYLGQFDQMLGDSSFLSLAPEPCGDTSNPAARRRHLLEINSLVSDGQLQAEFSFSRSIHKPGTIETVANRFLDNLRELISHCMQPDAGAFTASDFPLAGLDGEQLDRVVSLALDTGASRKEIEDIYPLSPLQGGMLYHSLLEPEKGFFFEQYQGEINEVVIDQEKFRQSWQLALERNPILRSAFFWEGLERSLQVVFKHCDLPFTYHDWRDRPAEQQERLLADLLAEDRSSHFATDRAPLVRIGLIRLADQSYRLVWSYHHLLLDGWSVPLLLTEVFEIYDRLVKNDALQLPRTRPYRDFIAWLDRQDNGTAEQFWRNRLAGFTAPNSMSAFEKAQPSSGGLSDEIHFILDQDKTARLQEVAQRYGVTLNTIFQGLWGFLLGTYSNTRDVVFGTVVSGRPASMPGIESMIGLMINSLPTRLQIHPDKPVSDWMSEIQAQHAEIREFEYSALVDVHGWSDVPGDQPIFETLFVFENYPTGQAAAGSGIELQGASISEINNYPLSIMVQPGKEITLDFCYAADRFDPGALNRLAEHLECLVDAVVADPGQLVGSLPTLTGHHKQLLLELNQTGGDYPDQCIHELTAEQAARSGDRVAVCYNGTEMTYRELDTRADRLAGHMCSLGLEPGGLVGLCLERTPDILVAMLATLKAGAAYLPLDPEYPQDRFEFILEDAQVAMLLTSEALEERIPDSDKPVVSLDRDRAVIDRYEPTPPAVSVTPEAIAYVIYTSGSTGKPKGVKVPHRTVVNFLASMAREPGIVADDVLLAVTTISFDIAVLELFLPLVEGARIELADQATASDGSALRERIETAGVTIMQATPTTWRLLLAAGWEKQAKFKALCGGEALPADLAEHLCGHVSSLWNMYGPTETTVWSTTYRVDHPAGDVLIGKPIANTQIYILNEERQLLPVGVAGEMYIGGAGVTAGYLDRPELTSERFIDDPFGDGPARLYRTGDLVRLRPDGNIEYINRLDNQVKLRGFRIELGEIEAVLASHPGVLQAAVTIREDQPGDKRIAAYYVTKADDLAVTSLRKQVRSALPAYMLPQYFVEVNEFPLTPNGKVDRKALPVPQGVSSASDTYVAPRNASERLLAEVWQEALKAEKVGIYDNFFELGGHSLLSIQVAVKIKEKTGFKLELKSMLVETLEQLASQLPSSMPDDERPIEKAEVESLASRITRRIRGMLAIG